MYNENGHSFAVARPKHSEELEDLTKYGSFADLHRDGRYLVPVRSYGDSVMLSSCRPYLFELQRKHVRFRTGDIVIQSFPRSGTTWMEQVVLLLLRRGDPSLLNPAHKNMFNPAYPERGGKLLIDTMYYDSPIDCCEPWGHAAGQDILVTAEDINAVKTRRVFKTHYPPHMQVGMGEEREALERGVPPPFNVTGVKIIFVIRDPKDVALSNMRVQSLNLEKHGFPVPAYVKLFLEGKVVVGHWGQYVKDWLKVIAMHPECFLVVRYEENKADPLGTARKIGEFLDIEISEPELQACVHYSSFDVMKENSKTDETPHMHFGKVGGWRKSMSPEMVEAFNEMLDDPGLGEYGKSYIHHFE